MTQTLFEKEGSNFITEDNFNKDYPSYINREFIDTLKGSIQKTKLSKIEIVGYTVKAKLEAIRAVGYANILEKEGVTEDVCFWQALEELNK